MKNACLVKKGVWDAALMIQEPAHHVLQDITCSNTTVIKPVLRKPTGKRLDAKRVKPTAAAATRMSVTGVKRGSSSWAAVA